MIVHASSLLICLLFISSLQKISSIQNNFTIGKQFCPIVRSDSLIIYGKEHHYANKVPKIIHYIYKTSYIPTQYSLHVKNCMQINKDAAFVFWTDFVAHRLLINYFTNYSSLFSSYFTNKDDMLKISDSIRYFILYKFGGIYMDLDTKCQKPFDIVMINDSCILSQELNEQTQILHNLPYLAMNSLMASIPNHDFFKYVINKLRKEDGSGVLEQTGPKFLTKSFDAYKKLLANKTNPLQQVTLADPYIYSPHIAKPLGKYCFLPSGKWRMKGCKDLYILGKFQKKKLNDAIVVHLFMNLGYSYKKSSIIKLDHVCFVFRNIRVVWF